VANDIGDFLRSRRARVKPAQAGLPAGLTMRRVPGLRREELATLAGVSVDYYVHLEQGRSAHVSQAVLDSIARVLRLDDVEQEHLSNLAHPRRHQPQQTQPVSARTQRLLDVMFDVPALIIGRRMQVLGHNDAAAAVFDMATLTHGVAQALFLDPSAAAAYLNWDTIATEIVGHLRLESGRYPTDHQLAALITQLSVNSDAFRRLWALRDVDQKTSGTTRIAHPLVGELEFDYNTMLLPAEPGHFLIAYSYHRDSPTAERMQLLLSWNTAPPAEPARRSSFNAG